jgi:anti-anti-sigma regulatory factor
LGQANPPIHMHMVPCDGANFVALEGELHESNLEAVEKALVALAQTGELLVLDLDRLIVDDPGAARIFVWVAAAADYTGGAVVIADPSTTVSDALRSLGAAWLLTPEE